uniref:ORF3 n=1 Tax=Giant panda anellovirus TaxID=2016460 RepID=A0A220IGK7_9VIRU|nr:ORF3 [Giant panda anellovirus]
MNLLSEEKRGWWRSSPRLYSSGESESEGTSRGGMKKRKSILVPQTPTPKYSKINVSGVWPHASDSDWSESSGQASGTRPGSSEPSLTSGRSGSTGGRT